MTWSNKNSYAMFPVIDGNVSDTMENGDKTYWKNAKSGAASKSEIAQMAKFGDALRCSPEDGIEYECLPASAIPRELEYSGPAPRVGCHKYYYFTDPEGRKYPLADYVIEALINEERYGWHAGKVSATWTVEKRNGRWFGLVPDDLVVEDFFHGNYETFQWRTGHW